MQIVSMNVGEKRTQPKGDALETTGIYKMPVNGPVHIGALGVPEDFICDQRNHGGPDQAIYIYGVPDYEWWSRELGEALGPGTFGENLTLTGFESAGYHIGDRLQIGAVVLEFTAPRIPCSTLARRMRDAQFVKKYRLAERPGMYCRVIHEGAVQAGDMADLIPFDGPTVSSLEIFREHQGREKHIELLRRILDSPVAIRERLQVEEDLRRLTGG
ncbi:MAG TPA: MOSC domain-containing protein [Anaerolineales bacterium]|nr:MOSC domain-containing protein [Anaerolineales bacterium]